MLEKTLAEVAVPRRRPTRSPTIRPSSCSTARGSRCSRSPAPTACRRATAPATCCAPTTSLYLSLRLPPTVEPVEASEQPRPRSSTADPPYGANVSYRADKHSQGWNAPAFAPWLWDSLQRGSHGVLRHAGLHVRRGRLDLVHGHARRAVPRRAVRDHRRARPGQQRPRPERVPAHPDRQEAHRRAGAAPAGPRNTRRVILKAA